MLPCKLPAGSLPPSFRLLSQAPLQGQTKKAKKAHEHKAVMLSINNQHGCMRPLIVEGVSLCTRTRHASPIFRGGGRNSPDMQGSLPTSCQGSNSWIKYPYFLGYKLTRLESGCGEAHTLQFLHTLIYERTSDVTGDYLRTCNECVELTLTLVAERHLA